jgi:signal transduction histidine kinase
MNQALPLPEMSRAQAPESRGDAAEMLGEQVRMAYANLPISQAVALANGLLLAVVLSSVVDMRLLGGWLATLVAVTIARMILQLQFRRASPTAEAMSDWRSYHLVGALAAGLVWGATAVLLYPAHTIVYQVFVAFVVGGMVLGAMVALTPMFQAYLLFTICALAPLLVRYLMVGDPVHRAMAGMGAIFMAAMLVLGKRIHDNTIESLRLRFENRELIDYLSSSKQHLLTVNADLLATQEKLTRANEALETRVAERTAELQAADRRKDEFLAVLSHELRNPLAPIRNSIYLLNHLDPASDQAQRARDIIERQTQHITRLVDDLLDVTRIARGKIELRRIRADLTELVRKTVQDYAPTFQQYDIVLAIDLPAHPIWVRIDPTRIAQLVGNLLQNAANFTPAQGRVAVSLQRADRWTEIRVADTGTGIAPELLPGLFEPFMQGKQSLARTEGGLGLGLALVKGIAELHEGTVRVDSGGPGKGATFTVRLPLLHDDTASIASPPQPPGRTRGRRVLVVDDNSDAADSLAELVQMFGHRAEVAYDGTAALEKARANPPDVMLCDLGLPGVTGYEVARALRAGGKTIRLIAVSGYAQPEDIAAAIDAGFERHVAKPLDPDTVQGLLQ